MMMIGMKMTMMTTMMTSCQIFSEEANHVDRLVMQAQVEAHLAKQDQAEAQVALVEAPLAKQDQAVAQVALVEAPLVERDLVEVFQALQVRVEAPVAQVEAQEVRVKVRRSPSVNQLAMLMLERQ
tara:strand:+ start:564 stop:938 length:375 start_codon:yes stop_codon:yes gene_type:complete